MSYIIVTPKGRKALSDEFVSFGAAEQAHLNLIYGAKLGDTKKGNDDALKYMRYKIVEKDSKYKKILITCGEHNLVICRRNGKIETVKKGFFKSNNRTLEIYNDRRLHLEDILINDCQIETSTL